MIILLTVFGLLICPFLWLFIKGILILYIRMLRYRKYGFTTKFYFSGSPLTQQYQDSLAYGDYIKGIKDLAKDSSNSKGEVSNLFGHPLVIIKDCEMLKDYFISKHKYFEKTDATNQFRQRMIGKHNLIMSNYEEWKKKRALISNAFNFSKIQQSRVFIQEIVRVHFDQVKENEILDSMKFFEKITGDSFFKAFFGENVHEEKINGLSLTEEIAELVNMMSDLTQGYFLLVSILLFGGKLFDFRLKRRAFDIRFNAFKNYLRSFISRKRNALIKEESKFDKNSIIYDLLKEKELNDEDIANEIIILYIAGTDTTAHLLNSMVYAVEAFGLKKEILDEINSVIKNDADFNSENISEEKMPKLNALIKECLRLYTPAYALFYRQAQTDVELAGVYIKKGEQIMIAPMLVSNNPEFFSEPEKFNIQRWLNKEFETVMKNNPFCYFPFSAGTRNCIGQHFAKLEAKLIFIQFCQEFDFELLNKEVKWFHRFLYEPLDPFKIKIRKRNSKVPN